MAKRLSEIDVFTDIRTMPYDEAVKAGFIETLGAETDEKFLTQVMGQANDPETVAKVADTFKVVYTPFHGTGYQLIPEALRRLGIRQLLCVPEQMVIDGNFPTVVSPNPENPGGFAWQWTLPSGRGLTSSWVPTPMPRPGGHHGPHQERGVPGDLRQPDRCAAAGLSDWCQTALRQDAGKPRGPQNDCHHGDGPEGGRDQRPSVL